MIASSAVTPVTPYILGCLGLNPKQGAGCDTVTPVTATSAYRGVRVHAPRVSLVSQVEHFSVISGLGV